MTLKLHVTCSMRSSGSRRLVWTRTTSKRRSIPCCDFCSRLGYDLAMISFVDRDAGVIRAARATGSMTGLVDLTVRPIDGEDILADVVRESRAVIIPDSRTDPRCDRDAVAVSGIRGQIVVPLVSDLVLGTLQVASHTPLDPSSD